LGEASPVLNFELVLFIDVIESPPVFKCVINKGIGVSQDEGQEFVNQ
jgi:hypothetical protein